MIPYTCERPPLRASLSLSLRLLQRAAGRFRRVSARVDSSSAAEITRRVFTRVADGAVTCRLLFNRDFKRASSARESCIAFSGRPVDPKVKLPWLSSRGSNRTHHRVSNYPANFTKIEAEPKLRRSRKICGNRDFLRALCD